MTKVLARQRKLDQEEWMCVTTNVSECVLASMLHIPTIWPTQFYFKSFKDKTSLEKRGVGKNIVVILFFFGKAWLEVEGWIICNSLFLVSMFNIEQNLIWQIIVNIFLVSSTFCWGDFIISKRTFLSVKFSVYVVVVIVVVIVVVVVVSVR